MISNAWICSTNRHGAFSQVGARGGYGYLWWLSKNYEDRPGRRHSCRRQRRAVHLHRARARPGGPCSPARTTTRTRRICLSAADDLRPCRRAAVSPQAAVPPGTPALSGAGSLGTPRRAQRRLSCGLGVIGRPRVGLALGLFFFFLLLASSRCRFEGVIGLATRAFGSLKGETCPQVSVC